MTEQVKTQPTAVGPVARVTSGDPRTSAAGMVLCVSVTSRVGDIEFVDYETREALRELATSSSAVSVDSSVLVWILDELAKFEEDQAIRDLDEDWTDGLGCQGVTASGERCQMQDLDLVGPVRVCAVHAKALRCEVEADLGRRIVGPLEREAGLLRKEIEALKAARAALMRKRVPVSAELRARIMGRDGYRCVYCGESGTDRRGPDGRSWHIDHVLAVSKGGFSTLENLALACATCNEAKAAKSINEWRLDQ